MNRKEKGYLFLGLGTSWAISRLVALLRGEALVPSLIGLAIATVLVIGGIMMANELEFALSLPSREKKNYEQYLQKYD